MQTRHEKSDSSAQCKIDHEGAAWAHYSPWSYMYPGTELHSLCHT